MTASRHEFQVRTTPGGRFTLHDFFSCVFKAEFRSGVDFTRDMLAYEVIFDHGDECRPLNLVKDELGNTCFAFPEPDCGVAGPEHVEIDHDRRRIIIHLECA